MAIINCPDCGYKITVGTTTCPQCGAVLDKATKPADQVQPPIYNDNDQQQAPPCGGGNRNKMLWIICSIIFTVIIGGCVYGWLYHKEKVAKEQLIEKQARQKFVADSIEKAHYNGHEYVDLGLSVKWATCNIGASFPEDFGAYYRFHDLKVNDSEDDDGDERGSTIDIARSLWKGNWRLPTKKELKELIHKCNCKWTKSKGKFGYRITASNGKSIFLPAAGCMDDPDFEARSIYVPNEYGLYWSSTLNNYTDVFLLFSETDNTISDEDPEFNIDDMSLSIRPVCK